MSLLQGVGLTKRYGANVVVDGVNVDVNAGERVGVVGESGSGKSTLLRLLLRLEDVDAGRVVFDGADITRVRGRALLPVRRQLQVVFQDPASSLHPRHTVEQIVAEGLVIHGLHAARRGARVAELLETVGLAADLAGRRARELSGGQRQRVGIARALAVEPRCLLLDEPVSALDVSVQAQIVNLLADLARDRGLAVLFVAHDLHVVRHLCERVLVMQRGRVVEAGAVDDVFSRPQHPYTQALLAAAPRLAVRPA